MHWQFVTPQISVTITCGIQPTDVVTVAMEVLHNSCNMCSCDLPDMYPLVPLALDICTYQVNPSCTCYNHYINHVLHKLNYCESTAIGIDVQRCHKKVTLMGTHH